jgi:hypothetical protein
MSLTLKQGDTAPKAQFDLNADVTGATSSLFRLKRMVTGLFVMSRTVTWTDAANGIGEYQWVSPTDTNLLTPGAYLGEVVVTFADGRVERFPQRWDLEVVIKPAAPAA